MNTDGRNRTKKKRWEQPTNGTGGASTPTHHKRNQKRLHKFKTQKAIPQNIKELRTKNEGRKEGRTKEGKEEINPK